MLASPARWFSDDGVFASAVLEVARCYLHNLQQLTDLPAAGIFVHS